MPTNVNGNPDELTQQTGLAVLVSRAVTDPARRATTICVLVCLSMFTRIFRDNLGHFYYAWTTDENYSHGFLVPLISLYFANRIASSGPILIRGGGWLGSLLLVASLTLRLVTIPLPIPFLGDIAFLIGTDRVIHLDYRRCRFEALLVCFVLPGFHGPASHRTLFEDCFTFAVIRQPRGLSTDDRQRRTSAS